MQRGQGLIMTDYKILSREQVASYHDKGYVAPIRVMSEADAAGYRAKLEAVEEAQGSPLNGLQRTKTYLLFRWAYEIATHPKILDAVEDVVGPDIVVYHWTSWIKEKQSPAYVSWHQDSPYFGLEPFDQITAWLALSEANETSGCMRVVPASQKLGELPVELNPEKNNLLSSGQVAQLAIEDHETVAMPLKPGEISLHNTLTVHGSPGNQGDDRRIGFCANFAPAHVRPNPTIIKSGTFPSVMLVRGKLHHDYFPLETAPVTDQDTGAQHQHQDAIARYRAMVSALGNQTAGRFD